MSYIQEDMMRRQTLNSPLFAGAVFVLGVLAPAEAIHSSKATGSLGGQITFDGGTAPAGVTVMDAVIYLEGEGLLGNTPPVEPAVLDQRDITFSPHVLTVVAGQPIEIRNTDNIMHNINTNSRKNRSFNKSQLAGMSATVTLKVPEIVPVKCDVHSQMTAFIAVLPSQYSAQPGPDGSYLIQNVPAGSYTLVAWHESYGTVTTEITVADGQAVSAAVNFTSS